MGRFWMCWFDLGVLRFSGLVSFVFVCSFGLIDCLCV